MERFSDRKGVTLIEVMVVAGVAGVIAAGMSTLVVNLSRQTQAVVAKSEFFELSSMLQSVFNNSGNSTAAFLGLQSDGKKVAPVVIAGNLLSSKTATQEIQLSIGGGVIKKDNAFNGGKITQFALTNVRQTLGGREGEYLVDLVLEAQRTITVGAATLRNVFTLSVTLTTADDQVIANPHPDAGKSGVPPIFKIGMKNSVIGSMGMFNNQWAAATPAPSPSPAGVTVPSRAMAFPGWVSINKSAVSSNPEFPLDVKGVIQGEAFVYSSDSRLKENVREIPNALEKVLALRGVRFDWKSSDSGQSGIHSSEQIGLIAQEVEQIFPEIVATSPGSGMKSVAYGNLVAPLIEAVKSQQERIDRQGREIEELRRELLDLRRPRAASKAVPRVR